MTSPDATHSQQTVFTIRLDDLSDPRIAEFMNEHLADMRATSPPESVHALDLDRLRQPDIRFFSLWLGEGTSGEQLVGTGAIKRLSAEHGELKSMRTRASVRRQGLGRRLLQHLLTEARSMGLKRLSLETGTEPFFAPASALYEAHGFVDCAPFADYRLDPHSRYMTLAL